VPRSPIVKAKALWVRRAPATGRMMSMSQSGVLEVVMMGTVRGRMIGLAT
jgi:hypothetical protein